MDALAHICAAATLAHFLYWEYVDHAVSLTYPMHTTGEKNDLSEDKLGYYSPAKSIAITLSGVAAGVALWIFLSPWAPALLFAIWGVGLACVIPKNRKTMLRRKGEQFDILRDIRRFPDDYYTRITAFHENKTGKLMWYAQPHFLDVRCYAEGAVNDADEIERAKGVLITKLKKLAAMDEKTWWDVNRAKNL